LIEVAEAIIAISSRVEEQTAMRDALAVCGRPLLAGRDVGCWNLADQSCLAGHGASSPEGALRSDFLPISRNL
jgi:hypothetical protein